MSTTYNIEPPPKGQCVLHTSSGDILLELFAQQTPLASRNFLQLILDGYYTNTIFHRLVPNFVLQGGDPTGTGSGGESSFHGGAPFADEYHPRLKFNRRGLLGMANGGNKDENGSQFFLTLGKCDELNGEHTMFGRVAGNTIFNLVKMGEAELAGGEGSDRPLYPTRITGADIIENPFDDMEPRSVMNLTAKEEEGRPKKRAKKKAATAMLSFGGEEGEEDESVPVKRRAKFNQALVRAEKEENESAPNQELPTVRKRKPKSTSPTTEERPPAQYQSKDSQTNLDPSPRSVSISPDPPQFSKVNSLLERTNAQINGLKSSLKRQSVAAPPPETHRSRLSEMIPATATRGRKRGAGATSTREEQRNLDAFNAFKNKLDNLQEGRVKSRTSATKAPAAVDDNIKRTNGARGTSDDKALRRDALSEDDEAALCDLHFIANCQSCNKWDNEGGADGDPDEDDEIEWMSHSLSFAKDRLGKSLEWKRKNEEELVVIDPKEKAKELREQSRKQRDRANGHSKRS